MRVVIRTIESNGKIIGKIYTAHFEEPLNAALKTHTEERLMRLAFNDFPQGTGLHIYRHYEHDTAAITAMTDINNYPQNEVII